MNPKLVYPLLALVGLLAAVALYQVNTATGPGTPQSMTPVFDRVTETNTLRIGYLILPPYMDKNTATGAITGIFYDFTEELASRLNLKTEWVEEVNLSTLSLGLDNGRYDMIAFPLWRSSARARNVAFSTPLFFSSIGVYMASDSERFAAGLETINAKDVRVSTIDGELAETIAQQDFPLAQRVALPQFSDYSQMLLQVTSGKADVTFFNRVLAERFIAQNPGSLKDISGDQPIRVFAECFILPLRDPAFKGMIDASVHELIENGFLDKLFLKYHENPLEYYRVARPYRIPTL